MAASRTPSRPPWALAALKQRTISSVLSGSITLDSTLGGSSLAMGFLWSTSSRTKNLKSRRAKL
jgi:hypothetical protein